MDNIEAYLRSDIDLVKRFIAETPVEAVIELKGWEGRLEKLNSDLTEHLNSKDNISQISDRPEIMNIELTRKELELIFNWYYKGYTHIDNDKPLFDKLQQIYKGS